MKLYGYDVSEVADTNGPYVPVNVLSVDIQKKEMTKKTMAIKINQSAALAADNPITLYARAAGTNKPAKAPETVKYEENYSIKQYFIDKYGTDRTNYPSSVNIHLDTSSVATKPNATESMFCDVSWLSDIDISYIDFSSKFTAMNELFCSCRELQYVDMRGVDTSKVNNFAYMFLGCKKLKKINGVFDLSLCDDFFTTSKITDCVSLKELYVKNVLRSDLTYGINTLPWCKIHVISYR